MDVFYWGRRTRRRERPFPGRSFLSRGWTDITNTAHIQRGLPKRGRVKAGTMFTVIEVRVGNMYRVFRAAGDCRAPRLKSVTSQTAHRYLAGMAYGRRVWMEILAV